MKNKLPFPENLHADLVKRTYMNPSEVDAASVLLPSEVITAKIKPYLPEDRDYDPVLLYGSRIA